MGDLEAKVAASAPDAVASAVDASANMDDMLGGDDLDLGGDALGANDTANASLGGDDLSLDGLEDSGLMEDAALDLGTEAPQSQKTRPAKEISPEDLMVPDDIMGGLDDDPLSAAPKTVAAGDDEFDLGVSDADLSLAQSEEKELESLDLGTGDDLQAPAAGAADPLVSMSEDLALEENDLSVEHDLSLENDADDELASAGDTIPDLPPGDADLAVFETEPEIGSLDLDDMNLDADQLLAEPAADALGLEEDPGLGSLSDLDTSGLDLAPGLDPIMDEPQDISGKAHGGIAALNRALVNLALLSDSKKALARMADAAGQAGVDSGAILALDAGALKPGIMWNRSGNQNAAIPDAPAGFSLEAAQAAVKATAGKDGWMDIASALGAAPAKVFASGWPNAEQVPTHILVKTLTNGKSILGVARFAGDSDHDGLKQSFAELLKAAGAKM